MNDLIWIGNTIYPRWYVLAVAAAVAVAPFAIWGVLSFTKYIFR